LEASTRKVFVVAGESVPESYSVKTHYTLIRYKYIVL